MKAYLDLGSNIDRSASVNRALELLRREFGQLRASQVYETPPVGFEDQSAFYNLAVEVETDLSRQALGLKLKELEDEMGRVRTENKYGPRNIDMDVVLMGDYAHRQLREQLFVLLPLLELLPHGRDPESGKTLQELKAGLPAQQGLRCLSDQQSGLRR